MKKIIYIVLGVLFLLPLSVKADMGAPEIKHYKATPKSGVAKYYDYDLNEKGTIPADAVIEVYYEYKKNGEVYADAYFNDAYVTIKLSDFKTTDGTKENSKQAIYKAVVFSNNGLDVYAGPSYINEKVGTVSYLDEVTAAEPEEGNAWVYIEKGNVKGYVDTIQGGLGTLTRGKRIDVATSKVYTEYYKLDSWSRFSIMVKDGSNYKKIQTTAPEFTLGERTTKQVCNVYSSGESGDKDIVGTIPANTAIKPLYAYTVSAYASYYVETDSVKGWVKAEYGTTDDCIDYNTSTEQVEEKPKEEPVKEKDEPVITPGETKKSDSELTPKMIIVVSICAAIIVVVTAIVIITLVNRKEPEVVVESKEEDNNNTNNE